MIFRIQVTQPIIDNAMQTKHRVMKLSHLCVKTKYQNRTCKFRTLISNIMKTRFIFFNNDEPRYMLCEISKMRMKEDTEKVEYVNVMCKVRITNFAEYFEFYITTCIYRSHSIHSSQFVEIFCWVLISHCYKTKIWSRCILS